MNPDDLIQRFLDGLASAEEASELSELLETQPPVARRYVDLADLHAALMADETLRSTPVPAALTVIGSPRWSHRSLITAAAASLVLGLLSASVVFGYIAPRMGAAEARGLPVADAGFESGSPVPPEGIPTVAGKWSGDFSQVVAAEHGIIPANGRKMLRFLRSDNQADAPASPTYVGEVAQVVDLRPYREALAGGRATAELSAKFSSLPGQPGEEYEFAVKAAAFHGDLRDAPELWAGGWEAGGSRAQHSARALGNGTWQSLAVPLALPADADFLVLECTVARKRPRSPRGPVIFPGHYVDDVQLSLQTNSAARSRP